MESAERLCPESTTVVFHLCTTPRDKLKGKNSQAEGKELKPQTDGSNR